MGNEVSGITKGGALAGNGKGGARAGEKRVEPFWHRVGGGGRGRVHWLAKEGRGGDGWSPLVAHLQAEPALAG